MTDTRLRAVLFDLDGTLVDTLPDIAAAMNAALAEMGLRTLDAERIGSFVGKGPRTLALRVLDEQPTLDAVERKARIDTLLGAYVKNYEPRVGRQSSLYSGVTETLESLAAQGLQLAVVTNALQHLAEAILARFDLARFMTLVIGGDRVAQGKPHPEALLTASRILGTLPQHTLMVGDSENDVLAARAAGCAVVAVPYGYRAGEPAEALGCDVLSNFGSLQTWIAEYRET